MSTLSEVIAGLRGALAESGRARAAVRQAAQLLAEARRVAEDTLSGAEDDDARRGNALLADGQDRIHDADEYLATAENLAAGYLARIGGATRAAGAPSSTSHEPIARLRAQLPPDVPPPDRRRPGDPRPKTHGRWLGPDGSVRAVTSGQDEMYAEAVNAFTELESRRLPIRASDVELKVAAYMRNHGVRSAALVINNIPCPGPYGCDALVPVLLPAGSTLTVYGANGFVKTYRGGVRPPWRTR